MEINDFVKNIVEQFEDVDPKIFVPETCFRDVEGWSSLVALCIIAMVDEKYNVKLTGEDLRKSKSVKDIYEIVKSKI